MNNTPKSNTVHRGLREGLIFLLAACSLYLFISLITYHPGDSSWSHSAASEELRNLGGIVGAWFADLFLYFFGYGAYLFPFIIAFSGWRVFLSSSNRESEASVNSVLVRCAGFILILASGTALSALHVSSLGSQLPVHAGGVLGDLIGRGLSELLSFIGATLFLLALFLSGFTFLTGLSWFSMTERTGKASLYILSVLFRGFGKVVGRLFADKATCKPHPAPKKNKPKVAKRARHEPVLEYHESQDLGDSPQAMVPAQLESKGDLMPSTSLLDSPMLTGQHQSEDAYEAVSRLLEEKLEDFGVEIKVVAVQPGPVITRFEVQPAPGVKVSQISNLAKDIARSLLAPRIRVVEVIPGKSVVGIEIPNNDREIVCLSEILSSKAFKTTSSRLTLCLGKDIAGHPVVADLAKMPHLLVAGATGSGKSVAVNAMILSLLFNATATQVRLILIDPKMLELSVYEGIPHLLAPVVTDMSEAASALRWCVAEMDNRYRLMATLGVRNLSGYNEKIDKAIQDGSPLTAPSLDGETEGPLLEKMPWIVVVIDELADLMMVAGKKVEELIARLAQKARAAGIHLILATQRPSVDVITGLIKANISSRIAFQVSSKVDSRTILDQSGAEQLLGHGDMLFLPPGSGFPARVHGAFVADHEVHKVVAQLKKSGQPEYLDFSQLELESGSVLPMESVGEDAEQDPLYDQALQIVSETRRASVSGLQRRLKVGYNRAARMVDAMEQAGAVGPLQSNGSREVLVPPLVE